MKGKILHFSIAENQGVISGDDGNRYTFSGKEWKSEALPQPGKRVDFDTAGQTATAIFQDSTEVAIYEGLYRSSDERCFAGVCASFCVVSGRVVFAGRPGAGLPVGVKPGKMLHQPGVVPWPGR